MPQLEIKITVKNYEFYFKVYFTVIYIVFQKDPIYRTIKSNGFRVFVVQRMYLI